MGKTSTKGAFAKLEKKLRPLAEKAVANAVSKGFTSGVHGGIQDAQNNMTIDDIDMSKFINLDEVSLKKTVQDLFEKVLNEVDDSLEKNFVAAGKIAVHKGIDIPKNIQKELKEYGEYHNEFNKQLTSFITNMVNESKQGSFKIPDNYKSTNKKIEDTNQKREKAFLDFYKQAKAHGSYKGTKDTINREVAMVYDEYEAVQDLILGNLEKGGSVKIPSNKNKKADEAIHTHLFDPNRDNLRFSTADIVDVVTDEYERAALMCGEEFLELDYSKVPNDKIKDLQADILDVYYAVLARFGAQIKDNGKLEGDANIPDDLYNQAVQMINSLIASTIQSYGGELRFYKKTNNDELLQNSSRIVNVPNQEIELLQLIGNAINSKDKKALNVIQQSLGVIDTGESLDTLIDQMDNLSNKSTKTSDGIANDMSEIENSAEKAADALERVTYHYGNLSSGKPSHQFGDEITAWFTGQKNGGRGWADGTGTYVSSDPEQFRVGDFSDPLKKFYAIDTSKIKLYENHVEESAQQYYEFIHKLEQFCIRIGSGFQGFDDNLKDVDEASLYDTFTDVFPNVKMSFVEFIDFMHEMGDLVKASGLKSDGSQNPTALFKFKKKYGADDIKTRFLKKLGYAGTDLSGTSFDTLRDGSVLFDTANIKDNIIKTAQSISDVVIEVSNVVRDNQKSISSDQSNQTPDSSVNSIKEQTDIIQRLEEENENLRQSLRSTQDELNLITEKASEFESAWSDADWKSNKLDEELAEERQKLEAEQQITEELRQQNEELNKRNQELQADNDMWQGTAQNHFDEELRLQKELVEEKEKNATANQVAEESAKLITEEADAMSVVYEKAIKAAEAKEKFANANKDVLDSILQSLAGLNAEGNGFSNLNKLINNLANNKDDRIQNMVINLTDLRDALSSDVSGNSFISELTKLASQGDALKDLATALQASKKRYENVKTAIGEEYDDAYIQELSQAYADADDYLKRENEYLKQRNQYKKEGKEQEEQIVKEYERQVAASEKYNNLVKEASNSLSYIKEKGNFTPEFVETIDGLMKELGDFDGIDLLSDDERKQIDDILAKLKQVKQDKNLSSNRATNEKTISKGLGRINDILSKNTKRAFRTSDLHDELVQLQKDFVNFDTSRPEAEANALMETLFKLEAEFKGLDDSVKGRGFLGNIGHRLADMNAKFIAQYFSFQDFIRYGRTAISTIIELDTALVDLRKTTTMNNVELNSFYKSSNDIAKSLGITTQEVIQQAAAWSRLGFSTKDQAETMSKLSSQFAAISPGMDVEQATDGLVSTMKAFDINYTDVLDGIMSKINQIGNTAATSNAEIVDMLQRSSAAMAEANNTLDETIALETAAVEITRSAETTGTAFKTLAMRIRGYDEEGELLDDYEELKGKIADLTKTTKTPGGISLFTDATKTEFKSTYQLLSDIHEIYSDLTDKQQAGLLETIAGEQFARNYRNIVYRTHLIARSA